MKDFIPSNGDNETVLVCKNIHTLSIKNKNASCQHGFGVMRGEVLKFKCSFSNQL